MNTIALKKISYVVVLALAVAAIGLSACQNTMHGAGRDIENAGETVQGASGGPQ